MASAQIRFGPQAGLNIGMLKGTDNLDVSAKPGWHGGVFLDFGFGKHFSIMPAALYSMRGFKYDYTTTTTNTEPDTSGGTISTVVTLDADVNAALGYLDIPVLVTIYLGDRQGFMLQAGPQLSYLITGDANATTSSTVSINNGVSQPSDPNISNVIKLNKAEFSLMAGLAYKFPKLLMVYARLSTGMTSVQKPGDIIQSVDKGTSFNVLAGIALTLGAE